MEGLRFYLFGTPRVQATEREPEIRLSRQLLAVLAYLLLYRDRSHSREVLTGVFWEAETDERARSCLTTALWRLRRALEGGEHRGHAYLTSSSAGDIRFNPECEHWLDIETLEQAAERTLHQPVESVDETAVHTLEAAVQLYRGDLLEGFYDDWALRERERLRLTYQNCLTYLMTYYRGRAGWTESLTFSAALLAQDPLREDVHREVMRLYVRSGQRSLALRQYKVCCDALARELGVAPMEETRALYLACLQGDNPEAIFAPAATAELAAALDKARQAKHALEASLDELTKLIQSLESSSGLGSTPTLKAI